MKNDVNTKNGNINDPSMYNKESRFPSWFKIFILKYWAACAAVFFIGTGGSFLGLDYSKIDYSSNISIFNYFERFYLMLALGFAIIMNYLVKNIVHMMHSSRNNTKYFLVVNIKGFKGFFVNLLYAFVCVIPIVGINILIAKGGFLKSLFDSSWGVEPFTAGIIYMAFDFIVLFSKNSIISYIHRRRFVKEEKLNEKL